jgi:hypothetical protein
MAIFASTTLGASDPLKAMSIKALEKRQADAMAQAAQAPGITPENTQTPIQGVGHVVNQIADQMNVMRSERATAARREALAQVMAGVDWEKGPTSQQIALMHSADPDLTMKIISEAHQARENAKNRAQETAMQTQKQTFEGGQNQLNREQQTALQQGQQGFTANENKLTREQQTALETQKEAAAAAEAEKTRQQQTKENEAQRNLTREEGGATRDLTKSEGAATRQQQMDLATQKQKADATLAQAERDFKGAQAALDRAASSDDAQAKIKAQSDLVDKKAAYDAALQAQTDAAHEARTKLGIEAEAQKPASELGKENRDVTKGFVTPQQQELKNTDPTKVAKAAEIQHQAVQRESMLAELDQAHQAFKKGINIGPLAKGMGAVAQYSGGLIGDREQAQRTELFDNTMNKVATMDMSTTLKGQSTDFEMKKFQSMYNNPLISMEAKREQFGRVLEAAKKDRDIEAAAAAKVSGKTGAPAAPAVTPAVDQDAAAKAWLADPANKDSPHREGVERRLKAGAK